MMEIVTVSDRVFNNVYHGNYEEVPIDWFATAITTGKGNKWT